MIFILPAAKDKEKTGYILVYAEYELKNSNSIGVLHGYLDMYPDISHANLFQLKGYNPLNISR